MSEKRERRRKRRKRGMLSEKRGRRRKRRKRGMLSEKRDSEMMDMMPLELRASGRSITSPANMPGNAALCEPTDL